MGRGAHGVDARLAAQPARRGHVEVALEARIRRGDAFRERDVEHVEGVLALFGDTGAVADGGDLAGVSHDALRDQEAGREVEVVAGGAHRDAERRAADADLERLLHGEHVFAAGQRRVSGVLAQDDPGDPLPCGDSSHVQYLSR
jgi:hypothetical protein